METTPELPMINSLSVVIVRSSIPVVRKTLPGSELCTVSPIARCPSMTSDDPDERLRLSWLLARRCELPATADALGAAGAPEDEPADAQPYLP